MVLSMLALRRGAGDTAICNPGASATHSQDGFRMSVQAASLGPQVRKSAGLATRLVGALFFFSGASSLIFETLFTRLLSYTFGNTAYAASTVLAAFLGGLALGAYVIGRFADRVRPSLLLYGSLELVIGLYGL